MKVDEIFGGAVKNMVKDFMKTMTKVPAHDDEIEGVKKDGKMVPRSRGLAALADATASAKKTTRAPVMPSGKIPAGK